MTQDDQAVATPMQRLVSRVVLGAVAPVVGLLTGWWGSFGILGESPVIGYAAMGGLAVGILLDLTLLRRRIDSLYALSNTALGAVAVFYSIMIYGFFMAFPVPVLLVSAGWGFAAGHPAPQATDAAERIRIAALGSTVIMFVACCTTAVLAFNEPSISAQVRGMLGLPFTPSITLLAVGSFFGGLALVGSAYVLARFFAQPWGGRSRLA